MLKRVINYVKWRLSLIARMLDREGKKYHDESVRFQQMMVANNEQAFEIMYSDPHLLRHSLVDERLMFFHQVAARVEKYFQGAKDKAACLDVGCGTGHLLLELRRSGFSGRLVGLDSALAAQGCVTGHGEGFEFYFGYLANQKWEGVFDLVVCTEVLEHCEHPADIVVDMIKACKKGGLIVITVPDGRKDTWDGHINFWSPESFKIFIESFHKKAVFEYFENTNFCAVFC